MSGGQLPTTIEGSVNFWFTRFFSRTIIVIIYIFFCNEISEGIHEMTEIDDLETRIKVQLIFGIITTVFGIFVVAAWLMTDLELAISRGSRHGIRSIVSPAPPMSSPDPPMSPKRDLTTKKELSSEEKDLLDSVNIDRGRDIPPF